MPDDIRMTQGSFSGFMMPGPTNTLEEQANKSALIATTPNDTTNVSFTKKYRFALPMSGIMNFSSNYHGGGLLLPLFLVQGLRIAINLTKNAQPFVLSGATTTFSSLTWYLRNPKYVAIGTEFESSFVQYVKNQILQADPVNASTYVSSYTYRNEQRAVSGTQNSLQLNVRAKSIKSLFVIPRSITALATDSKMARIFDGFTNFQLVLANQNYPSVPISSDVALYSELNNALGGNANGIITRNSYTLNTKAGVNSLTYGKFISGVDLETIVADQLQMTGYDNASQSIPIEVKFDVSSATAKNVTIASMVDMFVQINVRDGKFSTSYM